MDLTLVQYGRPFVECHSLYAMKIVCGNYLPLNSLCPNDTIWWHRSRSTLTQVMACCLNTPSHNLNQCPLYINGFCGINMGAFSNEILMISICKMSLKISILTDTSLAFGYCRCLRLSMCVSMCMSMCQPWTCLCHNSSPVQARVTKFGPEVQNTLVKIPIIIRPASTKLKGGYTGISLSVCPSVRLSFLVVIDPNLSGKIQLKSKNFIKPSFTQPLD